MKFTLVITPGLETDPGFVLRPREPTPVAERVLEREECRENTAAERLGFGVTGVGISVALTTLGIEKLADELQT